MTEAKIALQVKNQLMLNLNYLRLSPKYGFSFSKLFRLTMKFSFFQYLFEKAADSMVSASSSSKDLKELQVLYDESVKNTTHLEEEISRVRVERTHTTHTSFYVSVNVSLHSEQLYPYNNNA